MRKNSFLGAALVLGVLLLGAIFTPLLITIPSTGTMTYAQAAGSRATFVTIDDTDVHYVETPYSGTPTDSPTPLIVLLHGFGASTFSWRDVQEPLSAFGEVISYDRPGFGFTQRPTAWGEKNPYSTQGQLAMLAGIIEHFGAGRPIVLVGHSAGGQLAAEFALTHPKSVNALVLADPAILTTGGIPDAVLPLLSVPQIDRLAPAFVPLIADAGDALLRQSFVDHSLLTPAIYDGYHAPQTVIGWERGFWEFTRASHAASDPQLLASLPLPVLLITGANDTVVPTADTIALHMLIPGSTLVVVDRAGHLPQEERPTDFVAAIAENWSWLGATFP